MEHSCIAPFRCDGQGCPAELPVIHCHLPMWLQGGTHYYEFVSITKGPNNFVFTDTHHNRMPRWTGCLNSDKCRSLLLHMLSVHNKTTVTESLVTCYALASNDCFFPPIRPKHLR